MMNDANWLHRLSEALGLNQDFTQDWGICNADATRVVEFIEFYGDHIVVHPYEPEALAELILESFNDLLLNGDATEEQELAMHTFIEVNHTSFPMAMEYWGSMDTEAYPVSKYVRAKK
jgi:hypothetical protein